MGTNPRRRAIHLPEHGNPIRRNRRVTRHYSALRIKEALLTPVDYQNYCNHHERPCANHAAHTELLAIERHKKDGKP